MADVPVATACVESCVEENSAQKGVLLEHQEGEDAERGALDTSIILTDTHSMLQKEIDNVVHEKRCAENQEASVEPTGQAAQSSQQVHASEEILDVNATDEAVSLIREVKESGQAKKVNELHVYNNSFTVLPGEVGTFLNLKVLKLFANKLSFLPQAVGNLTNLEVLSLRTDSAGIAALPPLDSLKCLKSLELHRAPARPSSSFLPESIGKLTSLKKLSVCHYSITSIPPEIGTLTSLEELDFSFNNITEVPSEVTQLPCLRSLKLANNQLSSLPSQLVHLSSLTCLDVANNRIKSLACISFSSMPALTTINVKYNKLTDLESVPSWIACSLEGNDWAPFAGGGGSNSDACGGDTADMNADRKALALACSPPHPSTTKDARAKTAKVMEGSSNAFKESKEGPEGGGGLGRSRQAGGDENLQRRARQEQLRIRRALGCSNRDSRSTSSSSRAPPCLELVAARVRVSREPVGQEQEEAIVSDDGGAFEEQDQEQEQVDEVAAAAAAAAVAEAVPVDEAWSLQEEDLDGEGASLGQERESGASEGGCQANGFSEEGEISEQEEEVEGIALVHEDKPFEGGEALEEERGEEKEEAGRERGWSAGKCGSFHEGGGACEKCLRRHGFAAVERRPAEATAGGGKGENGGGVHGEGRQLPGKGKRRVQKEEEGGEEGAEGGDLAGQGAGSRAGARARAGAGAGAGSGATEGEEEVEEQEEAESGIDVHSGSSSKEELELESDFYNDDDNDAHEHSPLHARERRKFSPPSEEGGGQGRVRGRGRKHARRRGDRNPKPTKRGRWERSLDVSRKYHLESLCGFEDRLHDGFYDAGRHRPFMPLEELERERLCLHSREVIVVDREQDEELDVILTSAQQLLKSYRPPRASEAVGGDGVADNVRQRATMLALFVSDCFGGSDKSQSTASARLALLGRAPGGGTTGVQDGGPGTLGRVLGGCACGAAPLVVSGRGSAGGGARVRAVAVLPSMAAMCDQAIRVLKAQRGSNVVPLGALPFGICRHRAILYKYLCDRVEPAIPCQLIRGFMDHTPHAWNVVRVDVPGGSSQRLLVDSCRPLDVQPERSSELFIRYLPSRRIELPEAASAAANHRGGSGSTPAPVPVMCEEIGRGASGAIVRRCTFGSFSAAAKIMQAVAPSGIIGGAGGAATGVLNGLSPPPSLHELRALASLPRHPSLVAFYGHHMADLQGAGPAASLLGGAYGGSRQELVLYMEYMGGGSLESFLHRRREEGLTMLPAPAVAHIALAVARGLGVLHARGIIHRDIKSSNVLVRWDDATWQAAGPRAAASVGAVKIADFSSAVLAASSCRHTCQLAMCDSPPADRCVGTPRWMAPEVLRAAYGPHPYGTEADIWSFGCLLYELLTLSVPYTGLSEYDLRQRIQVGQRPQLPAALQQLLASPSPSAHPQAAPPSAPSVPPPGAPSSGLASTSCLRVLVDIYTACTKVSPRDRPTAEAITARLSALVSASASSSSLLLLREDLREGLRGDRAPKQCSGKDVGVVGVVVAPAHLGPPLSGSPHKRSARDQNADVKQVLSLAAGVKPAGSDDCDL